MVAFAVHHMLLRLHLHKLLLQVTERMHVVAALSRKNKIKERPPGMDYPSLQFSIFAFFNYLKTINK